ncbi:hypothetical protein [Actinomadura mexicana]|uniref:Uncharacterized protein n=1 Tax=Actinomadura mexicana TaxID=134959 RepID=A0A239HGG7_9ACTN|nr:hypothetical protein [Actinomadura mexicana]SNS80457.1 hypothetical protein SAMN06265355_13118 [Actinomadura mexicana]
MTGRTVRPPSPAAERTALAEEFPDWSIWASDGGHWYATRRTHLPKELRKGHVCETVDGSDLRELRRVLVLQGEVLQARRAEVEAAASDGGEDR